MDKHAILKQFEKMAEKVFLDTDEIRLYILLLANSLDTGDGEIEYITIKAAFGDNRYSMGELPQVCRRLEEHGVIEILSTPLEEITADNSILTYRILPFAGGRVR
ncbi:MAG: hypothetical protein WA140_11830 [Geobacteraceae bacterium]